MGGLTSKGDLYVGQPVIVYGKYPAIVTAIDDGSFEVSFNQSESEWVDEAEITIGR